MSMYGNAALFPRVPLAGGPNQSGPIFSGRVWDFYGAKIPNSGGLAITTPVVGIKIGKSDRKVEKNVGRCNHLNDFK